MNSFKIGFILTCWLPCLWGSAQADIDRLFSDANTAFRESNYQESIRVYEEILDSGYYSSDLFSNLGSAYLQIGNIGRTILKLEKALLIEPDHDAASSNLLIAKEQIEDPLTFIPDFILTSAWRNFVKSLDLATWIVIHCTLLAVALVFLLLRWTNFSPSYLSLVQEWRYTGVVVILSLILSFFIMLVSVERYEQLSSGEYGIVMLEEVSLYEGPDERSPQVSIITEGSKVKILDKLDHWFKVELEDKDEGWLQMQFLELVRLNQKPIESEPRVHFPPSN